MDWQYSVDVFATMPGSLPPIGSSELAGSLPAFMLLISDSTNDFTAARAAGCSIRSMGYGADRGDSMRSIDADGELYSMPEPGS